MSNENTKGPGDMQQELDELIDDRQQTDNQEVDTPEPEIKTETTATEEAVETKEETEEEVEKALSSIKLLKLAPKSQSLIPKSCIAQNKARVKAKPSETTTPKAIKNTSNIKMPT